MQICAWCFDNALQILVKLSDLSNRHCCFLNNLLCIPRMPDLQLHGLCKVIWCRESLRYSSPLRKAKHRPQNQNIVSNKVCGVFSPSKPFDPRIFSCSSVMGNASFFFTPIPFPRVSFISLSRTDISRVYSLSTKKFTLVPFSCRWRCIPQTI